MIAVTALAAVILWALTSWLWLVVHKGGHNKHLVGYFQADTGTINQIVHLWKFEDDAEDRVRAWAGILGVPPLDLKECLTVVLLP